LILLICNLVHFARNTSQGTLRVGDVVAVSGVGPVLAEHAAPILQMRQATASDASVLGVVYCRGEFHAASGGERSSDDSVQPVEGDVAPGDYLLVVANGLAQVSTHFDLGWHLHSGGGGPRGSASYQIDDSLGQWVGQSSSSAGYQIESGFWYGAMVPEARRELYLPLVLVNQG
jgi:hypothetical protein